jgi:TonB family protein
MRLLVRGDSDALRGSASFSTSALVHAVLLGLIVFGKTTTVDDRPRSMYDALIRPEEKRIVWYRLPDRLPEVHRASAAPLQRRPLRATRKFEQRIVAGPKDDARAPQLVWSPAPEVASAPMTPLPNVLAVELKKMERAFTPPATRQAPVKSPAIPDAPAVAAQAAPAGPNLAPLRKAFTPPPVRVAALAKLPDNAAAVVGAPTAAAPAGPNLAPLRKTFTPPPAAAARAEANHEPDLPAVDTRAPGVDVPQFAILGLNPSKAPDLPAPPASRTAGFSAGPKPQPKGAETDGNTSGIALPGVTVRDGVSRQELLAAIRPMARPIPTGPPPPPPPTRVSSAPDPTLEGRVVYTLAIQMPNVTSYSGSWMVWFAEREQSPGGKMRAPSPHRKVDPKYIASAVADGVQGIVRLGAVIRKTGRVDSVTLLRHLDERLDRSAMESLAKWEFDPALRDGAPVDVDAVFEIPFRLAPKPLK